jgi:hypothetical protein
MLSILGIDATNRAERLFAYMMLLYSATRALDVKQQTLDQPGGEEYCEEKPGLSRDLRIIDSIRGQYTHSLGADASRWPAIPWYSRRWGALGAVRSDSYGIRSVSESGGGEVHLEDSRKLLGCPGWLSTTI